MSKNLDRRKFLGNSVFASAAAAGFVSLEEKILLAAMNKGVDTKKEKEKYKENKKDKMPAGKIGNLEISRLILGGNLIGGFSHSRDLIYVSKLFKAYNTEEKIFETFKLAEEKGINTIIIDTSQLPIIKKYRDKTGGKIQAICSVPAGNEDIKNIVKKTAENGATTMYLHGAHCDRIVQYGRPELIKRALGYIKETGMLAGVGGHSLYVPMECEDLGYEFDYYVKTLHHDKYWSAHPKEDRKPFSVDGQRLLDHNQFHDNIYCLLPEETVEFMKKVEKPWIAFKTLAAGAIHPRDGFKYAFEKGADFIAVGMFDFQIPEDTMIAKQTLNGISDRVRPWRA